MFKVIGYGRLTKDPDVKTVTTAKGKELAKELTIAEFDIACKSKARQGESNYIKIVLYDNYAKTMSALLEKGTMIFFSGELEIEPFTRKDGSKGTDIKIINPQIETLLKKQKQTDDTNKNEENEIEELAAVEVDGSLPF